MRARARAFAALATLAAACGGPEPAAGSGRTTFTADLKGAPRPDGAAPTGAEAPGPASARPGDAACPHDGRWRACSVAERLEQSGLVPRADSAPALRVPFLAGRDTVLRLGRGVLHAFVYDDTARLARDVAALDTVRVAPRGGDFAWGDAPPTLVRSANLLAVLLTANEHQIERVQLALQAGPPQRNPDRP